MHSEYNGYQARTASEEVPVNAGVSWEQVPPISAAPPGVVCLSRPPCHRRACATERNCLPFFFFVLVPPSPLCEHGSSPGLQKRFGTLFFFLLLCRFLSGDYCALGPLTHKNRVNEEFQIFFLFVLSLNYIIISLCTTIS